VGGGEDAALAWSTSGMLLPSGGGPNIATTVSVTGTRCRTTNPTQNENQNKTLATVRSQFGALKNKPQTGSKTVNKTNSVLS